MKHHSPVCKKKNLSQLLTLSVRGGSKHLVQANTWTEVSFLTSSVWMTASSTSGGFPVLTLVLALRWLNTTITAEIKNASSGCEPISKEQFPAYANYKERVLPLDEKKMEKEVARLDPFCINCHTKHHTVSCLPVLVTKLPWSCPCTWGSSATTPDFTTLQHNSLSSGALCFLLGVLCPAWEEARAGQSLPFGWSEYG